MANDIASLSISQIARMLGGKVSRNDNGHQCVLAPGPGHRPKDQSLSVTLLSSAPDGFLVHSFSPGDDPIACKDWVRERLGLSSFEPKRKRGNRHAKPARRTTTTKATPADIAAANAAAREAMAAGSAVTPQKQIVATYDYTDASGALLYQVLRYTPKDFRQRKPDGNGRWIWSLGDTKRVPYHLPDLTAYDSANIFLCEGEKDADRLRTLPSLCATTLSGGTRWTPEIAEYFRGRDVVIVPDHDGAGREKAWQAATALHGVAASVRVVTLPDLSGQPGDKDVSDWLDADPARADTFVDICLTTPLWTPAPPPKPDEPTDGNGITLDDFYAYMPMHSYIFVPSREMWPASSVNAQIPPISAADEPVKASQWLDVNRAVTQMTWAPGLSLEIPDRIISDGGWAERKGIICLNLYKPPTVQPGNPTGADRWVEHVHKVYADDADHIIRYLAHRVQRPEVKINHALFLGGSPGIGKDTLLAPVRTAVGPWNFQEVAPKVMLGNFNGFAKSVILRVSEARDLGDVNRYMFYDAIKTYAAAPPDVLRVNEKNLREYYVANVCAVIITSNYKSDGLYLPADDRRHYVAWSDLTIADFADGYWNSLWGWYGSGGDEDVAAYLSALDISGFDPKAPPAKTPAFWAIVDANRAPEEAELADALDKLGWPDVLTLGDIMREVGSSGFADWLADRKNRRAIPHRFERCGYAPIRNDAAKDGLWVIRGTRQVVYARTELSMRDRFAAASALARK
jgi:hypothetical protein